MTLEMIGRKAVALIDRLTELGIDPDEQIAICRVAAGFAGALKERPEDLIAEDFDAL